MSDANPMCTFCGQHFMPGQEKAFIVMTTDTPLVKHMHTALVMRRDQVKEIFCCPDCFAIIPAMPVSEPSKA